MCEGLVGMLLSVEGLTNGLGCVFYFIDVIYFKAIYVYFYILIYVYLYG